MANEVIPIGTPHPQVLYGLVRKRAEIAGQIEHHRAEARRLSAELDTVDSAIRIFDPSLVIGAIRTKSPEPLHGAQKGEISRLIFRTIAAAEGEPVTASDILQRLMTSRGLSEDDAGLKAMLLLRVRSCLRGQKRRGVICHAGLVGKLQGWVKVERKRSLRLLPATDVANQGLVP